MKARWDDRICGAVVIGAAVYFAGQILAAWIRGSFAVVLR